MTSLLLALDQGTTSSRAILFTLDGVVRATAQQELTQHFPRPGWVEHDAGAIWTTQRDTAVAALAEAGATAADVAAIGIANQRETTVVWDRATGAPIAPAIVWQDRRTAPDCDALRAAGHGDLVQATTGLVLDAYFSGTKLRWLLDHVPDARARAEAGQLAFGTIDTWLVWNLTGGGVHVTDASNASRTMLLDIHRGTWSDPLLELLKVPPAVLPEVRASSSVYGEVSAVPELAGIPIAGIAGDQQAALFGQACLEPGLAKNTYGTGCFMLLNTGDRAVASRHNLLSTVAWRRGDALTYALEGSVFIGGATVQWLRDGLGIIDSAAEVEALAGSVPDTGGVMLVPAFTGLGAPHWDPYARGIVAGITRGTTRAHIARAALEGIAHQVADVLEAMVGDAGAPIAELRVDGGAAGNNLLLQFQADLLGIPILRPRVTETTALGAACLAGLAVNVVKDSAAVGSLWHLDRRFDPSMTSSEVDAHRARWRRALERSKKWDRAEPGTENREPRTDSP